jgi:hypothetical protein
MDTGPSVWVCRVKRPSNFSDVPSSVSTIAARQQPGDRLGIVVTLQDLVKHGPSSTARPRVSSGLDRKGKTASQPGRLDAQFVKFVLPLMAPP